MNTVDIHLLVAALVIRSETAFAGSNDDDIAVIKSVLEQYEFSFKLILIHKMDFISVEILDIFVRELKR